MFSNQEIAASNYINIHNDCRQNVNMSPRYARPNASSVTKPFPAHACQSFSRRPFPAKKASLALALQHHRLRLACPKPRGKYAHVRLPTNHVMRSATNYVSSLERRG